MQQPRLPRRRAARKQERRKEVEEERPPHVERPARVGRDHAARKKAKHVGGPDTAKRQAMGTGFAIAGRWLPGRAACYAVIVHGFVRQRGAQIGGLECRVERDGPQKNVEGKAPNGEWREQNRPPPFSEKMK